mgnify:CR=1 FL=1|tara:strand:+ start:597 stop:1232 length:636 start_codon:yes stop_codon:yes gene_type:complete
MALLKQPTNTESSNVLLKKFNGLRRTQDGMLYLTSIDPNTEKADIQISNFFESGKSDLVPNDGETSYIEERLELFNVQYFTGDNSTTAFTLNASGILPEGVAVFLDGVRKTAYADYNISGTSLTFTIKPANNVTITVGQINKRYKNNDSDRYQQFVFDDNTTTIFLINSNGDLVRRVNNARPSELTSTSDDFDTFETTTGQAYSTTYQSAV